MKVAVQLLLSAVFGLAFFGVALFVPAGTLNYWQAWVFIAVFILATLVPNVYLAVKDPAALQRRMHAGPTAETRPVQRIIILGTVILVVLLLVVSALDHRFGWSTVPLVVIVAGDVLVAVGLIIAELVVVQNSYAAATITVESGQPLVSSGLYGLVRHPMYFGAFHDDARHSGSAGFILGTARGDSGVARAGRPDRGRGKDADTGPRRLLRIQDESAVPARAVCVVMVW